MGVIHQKSGYMTLPVALFLFALIFTEACSSKQEANEALTPPVAKKIPMELSLHGHTRIDDYYWLKERDDPEVVAYLEAENEYVTHVMAHTKDLQSKLIEEFRQREEQENQPIPYRRGDYFYYERVEPGSDYPVYCRKKGSMEADEEIILDADQLAEGHDFFMLGPLRISPKQDILAYGCVTAANSHFITVYLKNLKTGELLPDVISEANPNVAWANDNGTLFYVKNNRAYCHRLGTDLSEDRFLIDEVSFLKKSKSDKYILIFSTLGTWRGYVDADDPMGQVYEIVRSEPGVPWSFQLVHRGEKFYFLSRLQVPNARLMAIPVGSTSLKEGSELISLQEDVDIEYFEAFKNHIVLQEKKGGIIRIHVLSLKDGEEHYIDFGEPVYSVSIKGNDYNFNSTIVRYEYSSMTTPKSIHDYNMETREKVLISQEKVGLGFDSRNYRSDRLWATAEDGTRIPISVVYREGLIRNGRNPLLLEGYGMYGSSKKSGFRLFELSLLDRGFIYAIAHVRGGGELGQRWHREGKLLNKKNSFTDFIACARYLIINGYTSPDRLFASGGSGGGLLMGGVITMAPDLFKGVIIDIPLLDIISMTLDPTYPYRIVHYDELGNPNNPEHYEYMLSYAPYDNIESREYPNLLVSAGFLDTNVQYWPAAKFVAKLRAKKTGRNLILLKTYMERGHNTTSGRSEQYKERALQYAFLLDLAGIVR